MSESDEERRRAALREDEERRRAILATEAARKRVEATREENAINRNKGK